MSTLLETDAVNAVQNSSGLNEVSLYKDYTS